MLGRLHFLLPRPWTTYANLLEHVCCDQRAYAQHAGN